MFLLGVSYTCSVDSGHLTVKSEQDLNGKKYLSNKLKYS
jgi:hypothetical protein